MLKHIFMSSGKQTKLQAYSVKIYHQLQYLHFSNLTKPLHLERKGWFCQVAGHKFHCWHFRLVIYKAHSAWLWHHLQIPWPRCQHSTVLWVMYCTWYHIDSFWNNTLFSYFDFREEKSTSSDTTSAVGGRVMLTCEEPELSSPGEQFCSGATELQDAYYSRWLQTVLPILSNLSVRRTDHTNGLTKRFKAE